MEEGSSWEEGQTTTVYDLDWLITWDRRGCDNRHVKVYTVCVYSFICIPSFQCSWTSTGQILKLSVKLERSNTSEFCVFKRRTNAIKKRLINSATEEWQRCNDGIVVSIQNLATSNNNSNKSNPGHGLTRFCRCLPVDLGTRHLSRIARPQWETMTGRKWAVINENKSLALTRRTGSAQPVDECFLILTLFRYMLCNVMETRPTPSRPT